MDCPTCHSQYDLPPNGVEGFPNNVLTTNQLELLSLNTTTNQLKCENEIDDNPAATKCLDCDLYLCEDCTAIHKQHKVSRHHKLATLAELKEGGMKQLEQKRYCSAHEGEELKLYCRTCQEVICRDCTIVTHKQHDYTFIKDVREELTVKMESLVASVGKKEAEYQSLLDSIHQASEKEQQKVDEQQGRMRRFIDTNIRKLESDIGDLKRHKAALYSSISQASASHNEQLKKKKRTLQLSRAQFTSAVALSQQLVSSASSTDLAMMSKPVIQQLETLQCIHPPEKAAKDSSWSLQLSKHDPSKSKVSKRPTVLLYNFEGN